MPAALGKAFITIHADTRPFARDLEAEVLKIVQTAEKTVKPHARKVGESIVDEAAAEVKKTGKKISASINETLKDEEIKIKPDLDIDNNRLRRTARSISNTLGGLFRSLGSGAGKVLEPVQTLVANIFNVPAASPLATILTVLVFTILPAFVGLLIGASAAVADLIGLLGLVPGALFVILGIVAPLIIAFQGIGEALEAVFAKDPKKLREALKGLSPAAQTFIKIINTIFPILDRIGTVVQNAFFLPIVNGLLPILRRILPLLESGLTIAASALGNVFARIIGFLGSPVFRGFLSRLFPAVSRIVTSLGPIIINILSGLVKVADRSLPTIERLIIRFGTFIAGLLTMLDNALANGEFQDFLEDAIFSVEEILKLSSAFFTLLREIFAQTDEKGRTLLSVFSDLIDKVTDFFRSPEGQHFLQTLIDLAILFVDNLDDMLPVLLAGFAIFTEISKAINQAIFGVRILLQLLGIAKKDVGTIGTGIGAAAARAAATPFQEGGIVRAPTVALIGEAGPEAVVPLNRPERAAKIMQEAGIAGTTIVHVYLGTHEITDILNVKIEKKFKKEASALANGPRLG